MHFRRVATPYYDDEREVQGQLYGDLEERLDGLEDLRANGAGRWAVQRLQEHSARWWRAARRAGFRGGGAMAAASLTFTAGSVLMLGLGVYLNRQGEMTVGTVLTLFRFSQQVSDPLWQVAEQLSEFQKAAAGTRRAARLLATESTIADGRAGDLPAGPLALDLDEVSFGYGTAQPVLHDIDLHLAPGTSLGIVGRTGSGKSSIGRLALRLWDPEVGKVRLGGKDLRDVRFDDLRRRTAVVTQEVEIFRASLRDNLTLFGAIPASDDDLRVALDDVGLDVWWRSLPRGIDSDLHGPDDLSAGEAQLLAFARVLLADPGLVVLDEASSRLDPGTERRLKAATARLLEGRTAVIIAHRLATLDEVDEILVLDHGHIVEHGARDALAADPDSRYAQLTQASLAAGRDGTSDSPHDTAGDDGFDFDGSKRRRWRASTPRPRSGAWPSPASCCATTRRPGRSRSSRGSPSSPSRCPPASWPRRCSTTSPPAAPATRSGSC